MKILITSGRAFVSLELARILKNHEIYIQEFQQEFICKHSKYVTKYFIIPSAKFHFEDYKKNMMQIIQENKIELVIPTCEDIFYISQFKDEIIDLWVEIWCDDFEKLKSFHSKKEIMEISEWLWVHIPKTLEFHTKESLKKHIENNKDFKYVVKPKYSRFANFISSNAIKNSISIDDIKIDLENNSYILQEYISGTPICSYSLLNNWDLVSHMSYKALLTYNNGSTTYFETFINKNIENFVIQFAKKYLFHWQISFDFFQKDNGDIYLIECNPRTTSGIHLLKNIPTFQETLENFINKKSYIPFILKEKVRAWFIFVNFLYTFSLSKIWFWFSSLFTDIVFDKNDMQPFLYQTKLLKYYKKISKEKNITLSEVTSYDIEYDGI